MINPFSAIARRAPRRRHALPIMLLLLCVIALRPEPARADNADAANAAVDIFVKAGQAAGLVPASETEVEIIKQVVTCALNNTEIGSCVRNTAVATVVKQLGAGKEVAESINCLLGGTKATTCLTMQLPVEAQPMVNCMISGQGNIADCGKKLAEGVILDKVPSDFQPVAKCMIESGDAKKCGSDFVISSIVNKLPADVREQAKAIAGCIGSAANVAGCAVSAVAPELKGLADCATSSNAGKCLADFAAQNLPAGTPGVAKDMLGCVGAGDFGKCAEQKGISNAADVAKSQLSKDQQAAIQEALDTINKLRPDAPATLDAGPNRPATIKNILLLAEGIRDKDWSKVVLGAGPELTKVAANILLSIFLTPAVAGLLAPAVEAMINNDVEGAKKAFEALGKGNAVGLAQAIFEWYENSFIDKPCALMGDNNVRNTICGGLSDAIKAISNAGGDIAKKLLGTGQDVLEWIGVWGVIDDTATFAFNTVKGAVEDVGHFLGIGSEDKSWVAPAFCGASSARESPKDYFANHYLACLPKAATFSVAGGNADTTKLNADCNAYFNQCTDPKRRGAVVEACNAMSASLTSLGKQTGDGMKVAAQAYTDLGIGLASVAVEAYRSWEAGNFDDLCDPNFWRDNSAYINKCSAFVKGRFPVDDSGQLSGQSWCSSMTTPSSNAAREVCVASLRAADSARKASLAGPNSDYCKKQKEWNELHPCEKEEAGKRIPIPGGGELADIRIKCRDLTPRQVAPPWMTGPATSTLPKGDGGQLKAAPKSRPVDIIIAKPPPKAGGDRKPNLPLRDRITLPDRRPGAVTAAPPKGRPSAMDLIGGQMTSGGMENVAGNAGGPSIGRPIPRPTPPPASAPNSGRGTPKSGGSGGIGLVDGASGNAPVRGTPKSGGSGGIGLVNGASGNAPVSKGSKAQNKGGGGSNKGGSPVDGLIDYGGCAGCKKDPLVVR